MNYAAIYHRSTDQYCYALDNDTLMIRLQTGYEVKKVILVHGDPFVGEDHAYYKVRSDMKKAAGLEHHQIWQLEVKPVLKRCRYRFELYGDHDTLIYDEDGIHLQRDHNIPGRPERWFTMPWINPADINRIPEWVKKTVWYQIFPERFRNGNPEINPAHTTPWKYEPVKRQRYYGGDLQGILEKLPYIRELGINGIYMTPVFKAGSNHKYDTEDYCTVDPHFGDNELLKKLAATAHRMGIRIMLDGVFNHCGSRFAPWLEVLEKGKASRYFDWFMVNAFPFDTQSYDTSDGKFYSFATTAHMPKLNTNNPEVRRYLLDAVTRWIKEFDIDGIRLDVANEFSHVFAKELRSCVKSLKPDFYLMGEVWQDSIAWLRGDEFDAVMNYPLSTGIYSFWLDKQKKRSDFCHEINRCYHMYMEQTNQVLFNLLDSHDTMRIFTRMKGDIHAFYQQLAVLMTMKGSPCIYYGTEIAMEGDDDPDCRRCMPWEDIEDGKYEHICLCLQKLITLRLEHTALQEGELEFLEDGKDNRVIAYSRFNAEETISVIINAGEESVDVRGGEALMHYRVVDGKVLPGGFCIVKQIKSAG